MVQLRSNTNAPSRGERAPKVATSPWRGFEKGRTPKPALNTEGYYPAFLRGDQITSFESKYGETLKIPFDVWFKTNAGHWESQRITILASENTSLQSKFMKIMQCINSERFNDNTDISQINLTGWVTVFVEEYDQYMTITDVERLAADTEVPGEDKVNPVSRQRSLEVSTGEDIPF